MSSPKRALYCVALILACGPPALPEQRPADFTASYDAGNNYAGRWTSAYVEADGSAKYRVSNAGADLELRSHLEPAQIDALYTALRAANLQNVKEAPRAEIQHDASSDNVTVRAGEWSADISENGGREVVEGANLFASAGSEIRGAAIGPEQGTAVQVLIDGKPFTDSVEVVVRVPGTAPGISAPKDVHERTWTLHFADAKTPVEAFARVDRDDPEQPMTFVPETTKTLHAVLTGDRVALRAE